MQAFKLSAQLREWVTEYGDVVNAPIDAPDGLFDFLANRLAEVGMAEDDPDVVLARFQGGPRKVRITGVRAGRLVYELPGGGMGMGLITPQQVDDDDRGKLSDILDKLQRKGAVG